MLYQVMKKERYEAQKKKRNQNEHRVQVALRVGGRSFTELQQFTGLSPAGLDMVLKRMVKNKDIIKKVDGKNTTYRISESLTGKEMLYLGYTVEDLMDNECKYYIDF